MPGTDRHDERGTGHHGAASVGDGSGWADEPPGWQQIRQLIERSTPDGHRLVFGIDRHAMLARHDGSDPLARGLAALLLLTLLAWWYVRRTLRPLDAISAGARRFGQGNFDDPIPAAWTRRHGELGELATTLNTMGEDIRQMLDAKRSLLLAISHEMRSPLTRARLHTELLPEDDPEVQPQREALLRDLREMSALVEDLLESERLSDRHVALQRESLDLAVFMYCQSCRRSGWMPPVCACCCAICWKMPCDMVEEGMIPTGRVRLEAPCRMQAGTRQPIRQPAPAIRWHPTRMPLP